MEVGPNSDVIAMPGNSERVDAQNAEALKRMQEAALSGQRAMPGQRAVAIEDWHPGNDPRWMEAMRATLHQPLAIDQAGMYTVQYGDCLRSIAERSLHMRGERATRHAVDAESDHLIQLNKQAYPTLERNPDYLSRGFAQSNSPAWQLRINGDQPLDSASGLVPPNGRPPLPPGLDSVPVVLPEYDYHHRHHADNYRHRYPASYSEGVQPDQQYLQVENPGAGNMPTAFPGYGSPGYRSPGYGSPDAGQAIAGLLGGGLTAAGLLGALGHHRHYGGWPGAYNYGLAPGAYNYGVSPGAYNYAGDPGSYGYGDGSYNYGYGGVVPIGYNYNVVPSYTYIPPPWHRHHR